MSDATMSLADLQAKIAKHAWEDPAFEAEFMADPKATFEKYTSKKLPAEIAIHAHYNTASELHFVLPKKAEASSGELSDSDLERVAGGEIVLSVVLLVSVTVSIATSVSIAENPNW